ncbi:MAG: NnrS family protein [Aliivibrio sp.]|uniref:NnrS family protein n=1 Tax=Aliivibrio sp. TaxID=1872443 RepID=UPI001A3FEDA9|nr:NnrS family protein [Aliivibrio sp.]
MNIWAKITSASSPLYLCGYRPFFLLTASYSALLLLGVILQINITHTLWQPPTPFWFIHELLFGIGLAMLAGFLLTAFPAWTDSLRVDSTQLQRLVLCWLVARVSMGCAALITMFPAIVFNVLFFVLLLSALAPAVRDKKHQRHRIFFFQLLLYFFVMLLGYWFWMTGDKQQTFAIMHTGVGVFIILLLTILSRLSMVVVNHALLKYGETTLKHLAKPPRRNFAIGIILCYLAANLWLPQSSIAGWLALACAASVLNILNDWHLTKAWRDLYYQIGYSIYVLIAASFTLIGINNIWSLSIVNLDVTWLFIGPIGLAIALIMLVVGQKHSGHQLEYGAGIKWLMLSIWVFAVSTLFTISNLWLPLIIASCSAMLSAILYLQLNWKTHSRPRCDGKSG